MDLPWVNACWLLLARRFGRFSWSWFFFYNLSICGRIDIWWKSFSISHGFVTLGIGVIRACLCKVGYRHWLILHMIMSCITGARSSEQYWSIHAGMSSTPVAFLGFKWLDDSWFSQFKVVKGCILKRVINFIHVYLILISQNCLGFGKNKLQFFSCLLDFMQFQGCWTKLQTFDLW